MVLGKSGLDILEDVEALMAGRAMMLDFSQDEREAIVQRFQIVVALEGAPPLEVAPDALWLSILTRFIEGLHIVIALPNAVGDHIQSSPLVHEIASSFPRIFSNALSIVHVSDWPMEALVDIATTTLVKAEQTMRDSDKALGANASALPTALAHIHLVAAAHAARIGVCRVSPAHFMELTSVFRAVYDERLALVDAARIHLDAGLCKLRDVRADVARLQSDMETKAKVAATAASDCEALLLIISAEHRLADEQRACVEDASIRIDAETVRCARIAAEAEEVLSEALPTLECSMAEVERIDAGSITEVRAYSSPPEQVLMVFSAVMTLFGLAPDW